jgi:DNA-nicking Smr family endonuclease
MTATKDKIWASYVTGVKRLRKSDGPSSDPRPRVSAEPTPETACGNKKPDASPKKKARPDAFSGMAFGNGTEKDSAVVRPARLWAPEAQPLDGRVERRLRKGAIIIEARLDLHGKTLQEAYEALGLFIAKQARLGRRSLLVITGKGKDEGVTLRGKFPRWCAEPLFARHIFALRPAASQHGGAGAWYVFLRKKA